MTMMRTISSAKASAGVGAASPVSAADAAPLRTILLHATPATAARDSGPVACAIGLAEAYRAHLTLLAIDLDVISPPEMRSSRDFAREAETLRAVAEVRGFGIDIVTERHFPLGYPEFVTENARLADLIVCGVDRRGLLSERMIAEHLLFSAGRPILVIPEHHSGGLDCSTAVIAWDGSAAAARALGDALPLLRVAQKVIVLTVGEDTIRNPSLSPERFRRALGLRGLDVVQVTVDAGSRSTAQVLNEEARSRGAGILVMGGFGHSRLRDFVLGGATEGMLDAPTLPTLMSH